MSIIYINESGGLEPTTYGLKDGAMYRFQNSQASTLNIYKIYTYKIECRVFLRGKTGM